MKNKITKGAILIRDIDGHILEITPEGGISFSPVELDSWNKSSNGFITLNNSTYNEVLKYELQANEIIFLQQIMVSLTGWSAHFKLRVNDGTNDIFNREYRLNVEKPTIPELLGTAVKIQGVGSFIELTAKMDGVQQTGLGYIGLNGYYRTT